MVLANPDLRLRSQNATPNLSDEQRERMWVIFDMLISLFERAYLLAYQDEMDAKQRRRWHSWEDYMREWSRREDFRERLPHGRPWPRCLHSPPSNWERRAAQGAAW